MQNLTFKGVLGITIEFVETEKKTKDEVELIDKLNSGEWTLLTAVPKPNFNKTHVNAFVNQVSKHIVYNMAVHENNNFFAFIAMGKMSRNEVRRLKRELHIGKTLTQTK